MHKIFTCILIICLYTAASFGQAVQLLSPENNSILQPAVNLELAWNEVPGEQVYQVQYAANNSFNPLLGNLSVSGNTLVISELNNNSVYYWRVRSNDQAAPWSSTWSFRTTPLPVTPVILQPVNNVRNLNTTLMFNWSGNPINKRFMLQISRNPDFIGNPLNYTSSDTFIVVSGLSNNSDYYWRVKAYNIDNAESDWSISFKFRTNLASPLIRYPGSNEHNIDTTVAFSWEVVENALSYRFQLSADSSFRSSILKDIEVTSNILKIDSLDFNKVYFWRLLASNFLGDSSSWSRTAKFKTALKYPVVYSPAFNLRNADTSVVFKWSSADTSFNFHFQLSSDSLFNSYLINTTLPDTSIEIDSLDFAARYFWRVKTINADNDTSRWISSLFKTVLSPSKLYSPADSSKNVPPGYIFRWARSSGAEKYRLNIAFDSLFSRVYKDTTVAETVLRITTLPFDSTMFWRVSGFNTAGDSARWTFIRTFTTRPALLFSADSLKATFDVTRKKTDTLAVIRVSNIGGMSFVFDSVKVFPDSSLKLNRRSAEILSGDSTDIVITFLPAKIDTGLTNGSVYFIRKNLQLEPDTIAVKFSFNIKKTNAVYSDSTLSYDSTNASSSTIKQLFVKNAGGNINLVIDSVKITGKDTSSFKFVDLPDTRTIKPDDSVSYMIEFTPQKFGLSNASLLIYSNNYPDSLFTIPVKAAGRGGELAPHSISRITSLKDSVFEALTENNKTITFRNTGNALLNVAVKFAKNKFRVENDFMRDFVVKRGDSVSLDINYLIPDFKESNSDTMFIIHNGFGNDTIAVAISGTFDSLASVKKIQADMRLNGNQFSENDKIVNENVPLTFNIDPELLGRYPHLNFRIKYFTGGPASRLLAENDGSYNFIIPKELVNEKGLLVSGQLIARDNRNKIIDSITVFTSLNVQVILKDYKTVPIGVPRSVPAEKPENANTKWIMFGFPFEEVVADTLFRELGGMDKMTDGEWIVYRYDYSVPDSFSLFSGYSFQPNTAYFAAQSLQDTFKVSYTYKENIRTRKLTDSIITTPGTNWKTISSPYLFDVQVDPLVVLRRYDPNNKVFKMTNIMKPGEGYFIEPSVSQIKIKSYGEYDPLYYPKALADIGWHARISVSDNSSERENLFSVGNNAKVSKVSAELPMEYASSPRIQKGLNLYTVGSTGKVEAITSAGPDGAVFSFVVSNDLSDDYIKLNSDIEGKLPSNFTFSIFDEQQKEVVKKVPADIFLSKGKEYSYKLIIGTEDFIKKTLASLTEQVPAEFALKQNYPNPFNPATTINWQLPEAGFVTLKIYDILGAEAATLVNEEVQPGYYKTNFNAAALASGVYIYRITAVTSRRKMVDSKKMVLLK